MPKGFQPRGYVANIIDALDAMKGYLSETPEIAAEAVLYDSLMEPPRPPVRTGALRRSGAAYVGNRLIATTTALPNVPNEILYPTNAYAEKGNRDIARGQSLSIPMEPTATFRQRQLRLSGTEVDTLRGKITIVYNNPIAPIMHEWPGRITDPLSGPHWLTSKPYTSINSKLALRFVDYKNYLASRRRR